MKKFLVFAVVSAFALAQVQPAKAQSFTITNGQTVTTAQTLQANQSGTVNAGGTLNVSGTKNAIAIQGTSTISNSGTIEQTGTGRAIRDTGTDVALTLTVTNNAGGIISAAGNDALEIQFGDDNIQFTNFGTVMAAGSSDQALNLNHITTGSNVVYNQSTGHIQSSAADAVRPGVNGFVYNDGLINVVTPAGDTSSSDGIDAQTNSGITIVNKVIAGDPADSVGTIEGERHGITGGNTASTGSPIGLYTMNVTNAAGFTIKADNGGGINIDGVGVNANTGAYDIDGNDPDVTSNEIVVIDNSGTIIGNGVTRDGDGVDVDGLVQISNSGTIRSQCAAGDTSEGVTVGGGTITNQAGGTIEGDNTPGKYNCNPVLGTVTGTGRGITLAGVDHDVNNNDAPIIPTQGIYGFTTVDNFGTILGDSDSGIALTGAATQYLATIINEAGGTIEGADPAMATVRTGANQAAVYNAGTIKADLSGIAIDLGTGDTTHTNTLEIVGGAAQVIGNISGSSASPSTLTIVPNASVVYTANAAYQFDSSTGTIATPITGTANTFTYAGVISNFSGAEFGSGTTILTSASINTYTGNSTIDAGGVLQLDGSIASAQTFVSGTLTGSGSIGLLEIKSGGDVYPGDVAGDTATLRAGVLTFDSGSTATFDIGSTSGSNDTIQSSGAVTIANGANLSIHLPAAPVAGSYVLISATSVSGNFGAPTISPAAAPLVPVIVYSDTSVTLELQSPTTISMQSSLNPSTFGQNVTFTATIAGGTSPSGMVTFMDGASTLGTGTVSSGSATFSTSALGIGLHQISASYSGDFQNTASTSGTIEQEVTQATSSVAVMSSSSTSRFNQSVTFTAIVTGQAPTGTVSFYDGSISICPSVALSGVTATCATATLSVGAHAITAMYSGDAENEGSSSLGILQTVQPAVTTSSLSTACETTFVENQPYTIAAAVTGVNPSGTVTFNNGSSVLCSAVALSAGTASCTTDTLSVSGQATEQVLYLTASYSGDGNNAASTSAALTVTALSAGDVIFRNGVEAESATCPIE